jgi:hypothetical protein
MVDALTSVKIWKTKRIMDCNLRVKLLCVCMTWIFCMKKNVVAFSSPRTICQRKAISRRALISSKKQCNLCLSIHSVSEDDSINQIHLNHAINTGYHTAKDLSSTATDNLAEIPRSIMRQLPFLAPVASAKGFGT